VGDVEERHPGRVVERDLTEDERAALLAAAEAVRSKQADVASL